MKHQLLACLAFISLLLGACSNQDDQGGVALDGPWKFRTGDHLTWANPAYSDSGWIELNPTIIWDEQGYPDYDGIGWYRKSVVIPSSLKSGVDPGDSIQVFLGKIDDCDQVFLNGMLIGENGKTITGIKNPDSSFIKGRGIWKIPRRYLLPVDDPRIIWDSVNVIAVRCYDHGGDGGMYDKDFLVAATGLRDRVVIEHDASPFHLKDSLVQKSILITNTSSSAEYEGALKIIAVEEATGKTIYKLESGLLLTPGLKMEKNVAFKRNPSTPVKLKITFKENRRKETIGEEVIVPYILTPSPTSYPSINSPQIFGVRPYSPFFFKVAASGVRPMRFSAAGLPPGLTIDPESGIITGMLKKKEEHRVALTVENEAGTATEPFTIVCGELLSLTPPMGWNSWNCWGLSVSDAKVRESAMHMVASGLADHGWSYINIDDGWEDKRDRDGNILPNSKFPDMKGLCDFIHSKGLKAGIYSSPGPTTCGGYLGSYGYEENDAVTYARWGMDYLKYDWCSYYSIAPDPSHEQMKKPYLEMRHALRKTNRDIHYSLCQYGMGEVWKWGSEVDGNSWRTTGDIEDTWESMSTIGFGQAKCSPWAKPGRWNDPDMLVVGWVGWGPDLHYTRLTADEQYTHISLWSLLASPLLIGCDLSELDEFTMNLLTNDEVIAVNQDPLGQQASRITSGPGYEIWAKDLNDGSKAIGLFNKSEKPVSVHVDMKALCVEGKWMLRDLWRQKDLGYVRGHFEMHTRPHGVRLVRLTQN